MAPSAVRLRESTPLNRARYRVEYPSSQRPTLVLPDGPVEVLDCSETGLRFAIPAGTPKPAIGQSMAGQLRFGDRRQLDIEGVVARIIDESAAIHFRGAPVPFAVILAEQHYLRRHFLGHLVDPRPPDS